MYDGQARFLSCLAILLLTAAPLAAEEPLMQDFMGINGHSILVDSGMLNDAVLQIRDYHNADWDLGTNTTTWSNGPERTVSSINVSWLDIYGDWVGDGFTINTAISLSHIDPEDWNNLATDAYNYGYALADFYGPNATGAGKGLINSIQIGNEVTNYNNTEYRALFQAFAQGVRAGDPGVKIVTAASKLGNSDTYSKSVNVFKGSVSGQFADLTDLVDVYAIHKYAQVQGYPTWRRTYVEDPTFTSYLNGIANFIQWRDANDPTAEVWITEFGYDAYDGPLTPTGDFENWQDVTMLQQAQYLTRAWLVFSAMDINKAYMYYFKDLDTPQLHSASGLIRNDGSKKPSFYAVEHMQATLGAYRFSEKIIEDSADLYVYSYVRGDDPSDIVWAAWLPTGEDDETEAEFRTVTLHDLPGLLLSAERLALTSAGGTSVNFTQIDADSISIVLGESPMFLHFLVPEPAGLCLLAPAALVLAARRHRPLPAGVPRC